MALAAGPTVPDCARPVVAYTDSTRKSTGPDCAKVKVPGGGPAPDPRDPPGGRNALQEAL